jgi:hypothetical protein
MRAHTACSIGALVAALSAAAVPGCADGAHWAKLEPATQAPDARVLSGAGIDQCVDMIAIDATTAVGICRKRVGAGSAPAPLRVTVLTRHADGVRVASESQGAGDAYAGRLTLFASPDSRGEVLVLADFSAEYCYGTRVLWLEQRERLRDVGSIADVLDVKGEARCVTQASSVSTEKTGNVEIRVAHEVSVPQKDGSYEVLRDRSVSFMIERPSGRFTRVVTPK